MFESHQFHQSIPGSIPSPSCRRRGGARPRTNKNKLPGMGIIGSQLVAALSSRSNGATNRSQPPAARRSAAIAGEIDAPRTPKTRRKYSENKARVNTNQISILSGWCSGYPSCPASEGSRVRIPPVPPVDSRFDSIPIMQAKGGARPRTEKEQVAGDGHPRQSCSAVRAACSASEWAPPAGVRPSL